MDVDSAKVTELLLKIRKSMDATTLLVEDLAAVLASEQTPGQAAKVLVDTFRAKWSATHAGKVYVVPNYAAAINGLKKLLVDIARADLLGRMDQYLRERGDKFIVNAGHSLPLFIANVNRYGANGSPGLLDGGEDKYRGITKGDAEAGAEHSDDDIPF